MVIDNFYDQADKSHFYIGMISQVYRDNRMPCSYINVSNFGKQSFKALYYKNRIILRQHWCVTYANERWNE